MESEYTCVRAQWMLHGILARDSQKDNRPWNRQFHYSKKQIYQTHPMIQQKMSHQECIDFQKDVIETREMYYDGRDYQKVTKQLFQINNNL